jgi:hypothetical protein
VTGPPDDAPLDGFATWQEQTAAVEALAKAAGLDDDDGQPSYFRDEWRTVVVDEDDFRLACHLVRNWRGTSDGSDPELIDRIAAALTHARAAVPVGDGVSSDGLREELARWLYDESRLTIPQFVADALLSRSPLAPTLAALDRVRAELDRQQRNCADCRQGYDDKHTDLRRALRGEQ